jgi:RsiW-degrading membrane proteinase PrsW (M82 family)
LLFVLGAGIGIAGITMIAGGLFSDATAEAGTQGAGLVVALAGVAFVVSAALLCRAVAPALTAVLAALCVPFLVVGAACCAMAAIVLARAAPLELDADHAALCAWIGATVCAGSAVAAALNWWHWLRRRGSRVTVQHIKQLLAIGFGSVVFLNGVVSAVLAVVASVQNWNLDTYSLSDLSTALFLAGSAAISTGAGTLLVWHGAASLTGVPSQRARLPAWWIPALAALAAIGLGAALLQSDSSVGLVVLLQAAIVVLPGLAILSLTARGGRLLQENARATWRQLLTMAAYGCTVAASIAAIVNTLAFLGAIVAFMTARGAFDGVSTAREFGDTLGDVQAYLSKGDQLLLLLAVIAVLGPLNEEFWKGYGVCLLRDSRPTRYQAFLFGVAAGVGFGAVEANLYGTRGFYASPYRWWDAVLLRGGASSLHALASGIVGLGWYYVFSGRPRRGFTLYLLAVGLHGTWNALNVLAAARVVPWLKDLSDHNLEIALEIVVGFMAAGVLLMLWRLSASLVDEERRGPPLPDKLPGAGPVLQPLPGL